MSLLLYGDCLEHLKDLQPESVDLIFCDLPYGQTSCKWDCIIDLDKLWLEFMRIKKLNTPIIMTCTTKFGVSLINSAPKKCPFRYDLVWCKSSPCGFLTAKKMPMRKHEMIYVFYEKLPFYDLSSHKHKFIKETENKRSGKDGVDNKGMLKNRSKKEIATTYEPPLPTSLIKDCGTIDGNQVYKGKKVLKREPAGKYDPPLPTSLVKEDDTNKDATMINGTLGGAYDSRWQKGHQGNSYDPPLPNSLLEVKSTRGKHSTEKPVDLMKWILKYYSKEDDVILDPTMGSGSMGVACLEMKRNFIGMEMDEDIFNVAFDRLNPEI